MIGLGLGINRAALPTAPSFVEQWADLSTWSSPTAVQLSSGRVYGNGQGAASGINHAFAVGPTRRMRTIFNVRTVGGTSGGGGTIVGVSSDTPGGAFTSGASKVCGIYFTSIDIKPFTNGATGTAFGSIPAGTVDWTVTVVADENYVTATAVTADGLTEYSCKWTRATIAVNNLAVFNSDARMLTGHSVGPIGGRKSDATVIPRTGIEGVNRTVVWTAVGNTGIRAAFPPSYDSSVSNPVAICFHGNGSNEQHFATNANGRVVANALLAAGYIVLSAAYTPNVSTWGAQNGLDAYWAAYQYLRDHYSAGKLVLYANSMGGIESLLTLADSRLPKLYAWCGTSPTADLAKNYANATFTATINTAYGIDGSHLYAAQTAGHDPMLMDGSAFRGVPMLFLAATDDTTVPKADNTDPMAAKVTPYAKSVQVISTTGGHSFDFTPYTSNIVNFFNAAIA
jgi:pimeloyl-ACP methyl ester carboxylesterase